MSLEDLRSVPIEVVPTLSELTFAPVTTVNRLLGSTVKQLNDLNLANAPLHVGIIESGDGQREYIALFDKALTQTSLHHLLNGAAPDKEFGKYVSAATGDFVMPDEARRGVPGQDKRLKRHEALGKVWTDFMQHRPLFLEILSNQDDFVIPKKYDIRFHYSTFGQIKSQFPNHIAHMSEGDLRRCLASESEVLSSRFAEFLRNQPRTKNKQWTRRTRSTVETMKGFSHLGHQNRVRLFSRFYEQLDDESRDGLVKSYIQKGFRTFLLHLNKEDKIPVYAAGVKGDGDLQEIPELPIDIENANLKAQVGIYGADKQEVNFHIIEGSQRWRHFLEPVVRWKKASDQKREFILDPLSITQWEIVKVLKPFLEQNGWPEVSLDMKRLNPLAGVLALAFLSQEIVQTWPLRMPDNEDGQRMGSAQASVLALIRQQDLLKSPLLDTMEQYGNQHLTKT